MVPVAFYPSYKKIFFFFKAMPSIVFGHRPPVSGKQTALRSTTSNFSASSSLVNAYSSVTEKHRRARFVLAAKEKAETAGAGGAPSTPSGSSSSSSPSPGAASSEGQDKGINTTRRGSQCSPRRTSVFEGDGAADATENGEEARRGDDGIPYLCNASRSLSFSSSDSSGPATPYPNRTMEASPSVVPELSLDSCKVDAEQALWARGEREETHAGASGGSNAVTSEAMRPKEMKEQSTSMAISADTRSFISPDFPSDTDMPSPVQYRGDEREVMETLLDNSGSCSSSDGIESDSPRRRQHADGAMYPRPQSAAVDCCQEDFLVPSIAFFPLSPPEVEKVSEQYMTYVNTGNWDIQSLATLVRGLHCVFDATMPATSVVPLGEVLRSLEECFGTKEFLRITGDRSASDKGRRASFSPSDSSFSETASVYCTKSDIMKYAGFLKFQLAAAAFEKRELAEPSRRRLSRPPPYTNSSSSSFSMSPSPARAERRRSSSLSTSSRLHSRSPGYQAAPKMRPSSSNPSTRTASATTSHPRRPVAQRRRGSAEVPSTASPSIRNSLVRRRRSSLAQATQPTPPMPTRRGAPLHRRRRHSTGCCDAALGPAPQPFSATSSPSSFPIPSPPSRQGYHPHSSHDHHRMTRAKGDGAAFDSGPPSSESLPLQRGDDGSRCQIIRKAFAELAEPHDGGRCVTVDYLSRVLGYFQIAMTRDTHMTWGHEGCLSFDEFQSVMDAVLGHEGSTSPGGLSPVRLTLLVDSLARSGDAMEDSHCSCKVSPPMAMAAPSCNNGFMQSEQDAPLGDSLLGSTSSNLLQGGSRSGVMTTSSSLSSLVSAARSFASPAEYPMVTQNSATVALCRAIRKSLRSQQERSRQLLHRSASSSFSREIDPSARPPTPSIIRTDDAEEEIAVHTVAGERPPSSPPQRPIPGAMLAEDLLQPRASTAAFPAPVSPLSHPAARASSARYRDHLQSLRDRHYLLTLSPYYNKNIQLTGGRLAASPRVASTRPSAAPPATPERPPAQGQSWDPPQRDSTASASPPPSRESLGRGGPALAPPPKTRKSSHCLYLRVQDVDSSVTRRRRRRRAALLCKLPELYGRQDTLTRRLRGISATVCSLRRRPQSALQAQERAGRLQAELVSVSEEIRVCLEELTYEDYERHHPSKHPAEEAKPPRPPSHDLLSTSQSVRSTGFMDGSGAGGKGLLRPGSVEDVRPCSAAEGTQRSELARSLRPSYQEQSSHFVESAPALDSASMSVENSSSGPLPKNAGSGATSASTNWRRPSSGLSSSRNDSSATQLPNVSVGGELPKERSEREAQSSAVGRPIAPESSSSSAEAKHERGLEFGSAAEAAKETTSDLSAALRSSFAYSDDSPSIKANVYLEWAVSQQQQGRREGGGATDTTTRSLPGTQRPASGSRARTRQGPVTNANGGSSGGGGGGHPLRASLNASRRSNGSGNTTRSSHFERLPGSSRVAISTESSAADGPLSAATTTDENPLLAFSSADRHLIPAGGPRSCTTASGLNTLTSLGSRTTLCSKINAPLDYFLDSTFSCGNLGSSVQRGSSATTRLTSRSSRAQRTGGNGLLGSQNSMIKTHGSDFSSLSPSGFSSSMFPFRDSNGSILNRRSANLS